MTLISELVRPLSPADFTEQYLFKLPFAAQSNAARFKDIVDWELVEKVFSSNYDDAWVVNRGKIKEHNSQNEKMTFPDARADYEAGATLLIRRAERTCPELDAIAKEFRAYFRSPIDIQIFCSPPGAEGLHWHYDLEDVFAIQTSGSKEFILRKNTVNPWPVDHAEDQTGLIEREASPYQMRCHLEAGDCLYVPAGYWHKARAVTPSIHLSIGVLPKTPLDYLKYLQPQLAKKLLWRQRFIPGAATGTENEFVLAKLSEELQALLTDPAQLKAFLDHQ